MTERPILCCWLFFSKVCSVKLYLENRLQTICHLEVAGIFVKHYTKLEKKSHISKTFKYEAHISIHKVHCESYFSRNVWWQDWNFNSRFH